MSGRPRTTSFAEGNKQPLNPPLGGMKISMEHCKKKWASIRDQLRRTLQKRKTKSGQASEKIRKYKYEDILSFLIPYLGEREGLTNVTKVLDDDSNYGADDSQELSTQETYEEESSSNADKPHTEQEQTPATSKPPSMRLRESHSAKTNNNFSTPTMKRKITGCEVKPVDSPASQLMAYILAEKEADKEKPLNTNTFKQDPVDAFLNGIAPALKSLDPILLHEAKGRIFGVVQEIELKQLKSLHSLSYSQHIIPNNYSTSHSVSSNSSSYSIPQQITIPNNYPTSHTPLSHSSSYSSQMPNNYSALSSPSPVSSPPSSVAPHYSTVDETTNILNFHQM